MYIVELHNDDSTLTIHGKDEKLNNGSIVKGVNSINSFSFTLLPFSSGWNKVFDYKTLVSVYNTNRKKYEFHGRVLCSNPSMDSSGLLVKDVVCEDYFGFFHDSVQTYVTEQNWTVNSLLSHIIDTHNAQVESYKKFTVGTVTVTDPNNNLYLGIQRENTWDTIQEKLINKLGGEIRFRVVDGVNYIDYLTEIGTTRSTTIEVSKNMISLSRENDPSAFVTRLIPLGAKLGEDTEERLTIASLNDGVEYIRSEEAEEAYGIHYGYQIWDDVTTASILLQRGRDWLIENNRIKVKYQVNALDLSLLNLDIDDFEVHDKYPLKNHLLGINDTARIVKKTIDICDETKSTIELGDKLKTLTEIQNEAEKDFSIKLEETNGRLEHLISDTKKELCDAINRIEGVDGSYFHVRYSANANGNPMTLEPNEATKYMGTCSSADPIAPTVPSGYKWVRVRGIDGENGVNGTPGVDGKDGVSTYLHIKYSNDGKNFTSYGGETLGDWMGICVNNTEADPTDFNLYEWKKIKGETGTAGLDGKDGIDGKDGTDGKTTYFHVKYSSVPNPTTSSQMSETPLKYIGTYVDYTQADSTNPAAYTWVKFMGDDGVDGKDGTNGIPGTNGINGKTYYLHIKYSNDGGKTFTANNGETSGTHIGVYTDETQADSTDVTKYTWSLMKGSDGVTYYTWIKYADSPTSGMSDAPEGKKYIGLAYNKTSPTESTNYGDYAWSLIKGEDGSDGVNGVDGTDGKTYYTWIKYADNANGTNMTNDPTNKKYIGIAYNKTTPTESSNASDYEWALFRGADGVNGINGKDGIDGKDGADGVSTYFYVRYSANANGNPMTTTPTDSTKYLGVCSTTATTAPTSYSSYTWTLCRGLDGKDGTNGTPGAAGTDGKTSYLHIKYSDDGKTFTDNSGEDLGAWIGTLVDFTEADSTNFDDYTWKKFTGDVNVGGRNLLRNTKEFLLEDTERTPSEIIDEKYLDFSVRYLSAQSDKYLLDFAKFDGFYAEPSQTYTFSFYAKGKGYPKISWDGAEGSLEIVSLVYNVGEVQPYEDWEPLIGLTDSWKRYSATFMTSAEGDPAIPLYLVIKNGDIDYNFTHEFYVCAPQLEIGNIPTDWSPAPEDIYDHFSDITNQIRQEIVNTSTDIVKTNENIILEATKEYVTTDAFTTETKKITSNMDVQAEGVRFNFETVNKRVTNLDGNVSTEFEKLYEYVFIDEENGSITLGNGQNALTLTLDENIIAFKNNGVQLGWWDGVDFHTGNIVIEVNERAQFGDFAFVPRSDGSLMFLKVGGN